MGCRRPSGQGGARPGVEEGGDQAASLGDAAVADGVDARVSAVELAPLDPADDGGPPEPARDELAPGDESLLALGQGDDLGGKLCNLVPGAGTGLHLVPHVPDVAAARVAWGARNRAKPCLDCNPRRRSSAGRALHS